MSLLNFLLGRKETLEYKDLLDEGVCPNCWGHQEYEGKFKQYVEDKTKANINKDKLNQKAFIQQFVETEIDGIKLKVEGDYSTCPNCKNRFKYTPVKAN